MDERTEITWTVVCCRHADAFEIDALPTDGRMKTQETASLVGDVSHLWHQPRWRSTSNSRPVALSPLDQQVILESTVHEPVIAPSAYRHRMVDDDIVHAYRNAIIAHGPDNEGLIMLVGPARDGALVEVGYVTSSDNTHVIVHAMTPARARFLR